MKINSSFLKNPIPTVEDQKNKVKNVSDLYEKQFLKEMVKAMRATVPESGLIKTNQGEKIFKEQLDDLYVDKWNEQGGIGLSDLIYEQIVQKYGNQMGIKSPPPLKKAGPIPLYGDNFIPTNNSNKKDITSKD